MASLFDFNLISDVIFEVTTAMMLSIHIFWVVMISSRITGPQHFEET